MTVVLYAAGWLALAVALAWLNLKAGATWLKFISIVGCLAAFATCALTLLGVIEVPR